MATEATQHAIDTMLLEERRYPPPAEFAAQSNAKPDIYERDFEEFWEAEGRERISWFTPFDSLKHYVVGAVLSTCVNGPGSELYTTYAMRTYRDLLSTSFGKVKDRL